MNKAIKTIVTIGIVGTIAICSYLLGTIKAKTGTEIKEVEKIVEVVPDGYIDTNSNEFLDNYVNMRKVVYWEVNDGLQLYYDDGSGYYYAIEDLN